MLVDFRRRFYFFFSVPPFDSSLAACLLDPSYCDILMPSEMSSLLHATNMLIIKLQRRMSEMAKMNRQLQRATGPPAPKRFKFL